jgi:hypothetical protein
VRVGLLLELALVGLHHSEVEGGVEQPPDFSLFRACLHRHLDVFVLNKDRVCLFVKVQYGRNGVLLVLFVEFRYFLSIFTGQKENATGPDDGYDGVLALNQDHISDRFAKVGLPEISDGLAVLPVLKAGVGDHLLVQPETHEVPVFKANVRALVLFTHHHAADFTLALLRHQVAGRLELFNVGRQVEPKDLCFFAERKQNVVLLEVDELLNVPCFGVTLADDLVFVNVDEEDFAGVGADDGSVAFFLVAEGADSG